MAQPFNTQIEQNSFDAPQFFQASGTDFPSEILPFPPINDAWFVNGFPNIVTPEQKILSGNLIDVFPVDVYATENSNYSFGPTTGTKGFYIYDGKTTTDEVRIQNARVGQKLLTSCKDVDRFKDWFPGSKVQSKGYWQLLQDFGGIDPGSKASQTVSLTSGNSKSQTQQTSLAVGFTAGIKETIDFVEVNASLSTTLTQTFSTNITMSSSQTVSSTVEFVAQNKAQRIAIYQFYRSYGIIESDDTTKVLAQKTADSSGFRFVGSPSTSYYPTNHFQKVFVLDPK